MESEKSIAYTCAECGEEVKVENGCIVRTCEHSSATVTASLVATVYGESSLK